MGTSVAPTLRARFAMAQLVNEDSTKGYNKGKDIGDHPAIVEWRKSSHRSSASLLVGGRFLLNISVTDTDQADAAESIAASLKLDALEKLAGEPKTIEPQ